MKGGLFPYGLSLSLAFCAFGARAEPARTLEQVVVHLETPSTPEPDFSSSVTSEGPALEAKWRGLSQGCSYLAPQGDFLRADGTYDVIFHFHAGMMSEKQFRESGLGAVFVSCGFGIGSGFYSDAFSDTGRFGRMVDALSADIGKQQHTTTGRAKPGHIGLASWSAGFAAVGKILGVSRYYDAIDTVVLMDSLHSRYLDVDPSAEKKSALGVDRVDVAGMAPFVKFAREAASGSHKKTMVMSHSSIIPPDYPSAAEATEALLREIGVDRVETDETNARGMHMYYRADKGDLHVRGFKGQGPKDHFHHLYLVGEHLRSWVVPRWKLHVYTLAGEPG